jgi:hypothetical protein
MTTSLSPNHDAIRAIRFTRARRESYLAFLRQGLRPMAAARSVGIDPWAVRNYRRRDPVFAAEYDDALEEALEQVEDAAYQMAIAGNTALIQFILTNRAPTRWKREPYAQVSVTANTAVTMANPVEMSLPELRAAALHLLEEAEDEHLALTNPLVIDTTATDAPS